MTLAEESYPSIYFTWFPFLNHCLQFLHRTKQCVHDFVLHRTRYQCNNLERLINCVLTWSGCYFRHSIIYSFVILSKDEVMRYIRVGIKMPKHPAKYRLKFQYERINTTKDEIDKFNSNSDHWIKKAWAPEAHEALFTEMNVSDIVHQQPV